MKTSRSSLKWLSWNIATAALVAACGTTPDTGASAGIEQITPEQVDPPATTAERASSRADDREQDRPAVAVGDGLARTPPMGFNDWNAFGCDVSEQLIKETADFFVSSGLKDAGYQFVNIDDCWALRQRGADGRLVPDPAKFPSGIAARPITCMALA
jgi:hypothetical protein